MASTFLARAGSGIDSVIFSKTDESEDAQGCPCSL